MRKANGGQYNWLAIVFWYQKFESENFISVIRSKFLLSIALKKIIHNFFKKWITMWITCVSMLIITWVIHIFLNYNRRLGFFVGNFSFFILYLTRACWLNEFVHICGDWLSMAKRQTTVIVVLCRWFVKWDLFSGSF